jgi:hypothetical protein
MTRPLLQVLLIADSRGDKVRVVRALQAGRYVPQCRRVATMAALRRALAVDGWDVLVCEVPLDGLELDRVLEVVRETAPGLPILLMSAGRERDLREPLLGGAARGFVNKLRLDDLAAMVAFVRTQSARGRAGLRGGAL